MGGKMLRVFLSFNDLTPLGGDIVRLVRSYDVEHSYCGVTMLSAAIAEFQAAVRLLRRRS
jgi:hypothetical protein